MKIYAEKNSKFHPVPDWTQLVSDIIKPFDVDDNKNNNPLFLVKYVVVTCLN